MRIETRKDDKTVNVKLIDRMSFSDHSQFREMLAGVDKAKPAGCVLDLSELVSIDSAGLGMLMIAHEASRKGGWSLALKGPQGHVRQLLQLACFDKILTISN